eukprot:6990208-Prymnesium_polylepis.1
MGHGAQPAAVDLTDVAVGMTLHHLPMGSTSSDSVAQHLAQHHEADPRAALLSPRIGAAGSTS